MAHSSQTIVAFPWDLAAFPSAKPNLIWLELQAYAQAEHGVSELAAWDVAYYGEN